jgi:hypothetical protein
MALINLTRQEQEVVINFSADDKFASVYSSNPVYIRKLKAFAEDFPDDFKLIREDEISVTYEVNRKLVGVRRPRPKREYSEEELQALRDRMAKARQR